MKCKSVVGGNGMYKKRAIEDLIKRTEKGLKGVLVTGPRQVGKSTVLRHLMRTEDI